MENQSIENIERVEWNNQPILTTSQLAKFYETTSARLIDNFNANKDRFVEGKYYFKLEGVTLAQFKDIIGNSEDVPKNVARLILWTKRGAARHAKMLNTDKAWAVFEKLEDTYFYVTENKITKSMTPLEMLAAVTAEAVKLEKRISKIEVQQEDILTQQKRIEEDILEQQKTITTQQTKFDEHEQRISSLEEDSKEKEYDYPDPARRKRINEFAYSICKRVVETYIDEHNNPKFTIDQSMNILKDEIKKMFLEVGTDIENELEQCKKYYRNKYWAAKSESSNPDKSIWRLSSISKMSLFALMATNLEYFQATINLFEELEHIAGLVQEKEEHNNVFTR